MPAWRPGCIRWLCLLLLLFGPGLAAHGGDAMTPSGNRTASFLGDRSRWPAARLELLDVQGLFGGANVLVTGSGAVLVQAVSPGSAGLVEKRYVRGTGAAPGTEAARAAELLGLAVRRDLVTIGSDDRPGLPDEARTRVVLTNADGVSREAAFWEGTPVLPSDQGPTDRERFGDLCAALRRLRAEAERSGGPVFEGPYRPGAWEAWVESVLGPAARPATGPAGGERLADHGTIQVSGGCEVYAEGTVLLTLHGDQVKVALQNKDPYGFFLSRSGDAIQDFQVLVDRETAARFVAALKASLDRPLPNEHPSTRGARVKIHLPLPSGTVDRELDEPRGHVDVDPPLEGIESFVQACRAAYETDRAPFLEAYEDPVVDETTPPAEYWIPGLRRFEVYEKKRENVRSRPDGRTVSDTWIVTESGRRFRPRDLSAALREIGYQPAGEAEAARAAAVMLRLQGAPHVVRVLDRDVPADGWTPERVPRAVRDRAARPAVSKRDDAYEVVLFGYVQAMSGAPEEWVKRWRVRIGPGVYEAREEETLWHEEGGYRW